MVGRALVLGMIFKEEGRKGGREGTREGGVAKRVMTKAYDA